MFNFGKKSDREPQKKSTFGFQVEKDKRPLNDEEKAEKVSIFKRRSFRYGSMASIFTAGFIIIVILINVILSSLSNKFPMSLDLTSNQNYKLTSTSVNYIKNLKKDIKITILAQESVYLSNTSYAPCIKIMQQYPKYSSHISINYVDLDKNPTYASQYSKETLSEGDIIVTSGNRYKKIGSSDLISTSSSTTTGSSATSDNTEQLIDSAIVNVTSTTSPAIMFTSGHDEQAASQFQTLLTNNNYSIETKNISTDGIDSNASALVILAPKVDFSSSEIEKIDSYLDNNGKMGKNLIVFFDPQQSSLPNLESFVKEWGIQVGTGVVYDQTNAYSIFDPIEGNLDSTVVGSLSSDVHVDLKNSRPLTLLFTSKDVRSAQSVAQTMSTSRLWNPSVVSNDTAATFSPSSSDKQGPFTVMAMGAKTTTAGNVKSNVLVSGSFKMINDSYLQTSSLNNSNLILNAVNTLAGIKSPLNITAKSRGDQTLTVTTIQSRIIVIVFVLVIPIAVLIFGLIIWLRRRHL